MNYLKNIKIKIIYIYFFGISLFAPIYSYALGISPKKIEISGNPGEIILGGVSLFSDEELSNEKYIVSFENFRPKGNSGIPEFTGDINGLATWFNSENEVSFNGNNEVFFPFSIKIPEDARSGGYFSAIFFESEKNIQNSLDGKIGVLVFLRVNGEISEEGSILSFSLKDNKKIISKEPLFFEYRFKNDGEDRIVPKGTIEIFNMFNSSIAEFQIDETSSNVLPGSFRKFEIIFTEGRENFLNNQKFFDIVKNQYQNFKLGFYKAVLTIEWGENDMSENRDFTFFFFPWHLITTILIPLCVIILIIRNIFFYYTNNLNQEVVVESPQKIKKTTKQSKPNKVKVKAKKTVQKEIL